MLFVGCKNVELKKYKCATQQAMPQALQFGTKIIS